MIIEKIYSLYEERNKKNLPRDYLGASSLGEDCERSVWLKYRWFDKEEQSGRILRLLETGDLSEQRLIDNLKDIGIEVRAIDPETHTQYKAAALEGHLSGSVDGIATIDGEDYILEFKTHNDRSFKELTKKGVEQAKRQHFVQVQIYMGLFKISKALYLAVNKNTDELYEEIIEFIPEYYVALLNKAQRLIDSEIPPMQIADNPEESFSCKFCSMKEVCTNKKPPVKSCRTCVFAKPTPRVYRWENILSEPRWECTKLSSFISTEQQLKGCSYYEAIKLD